MWGVATILSNIAEGFCISNLQRGLDVETKIF
jgi:hypothetical protein